MAKQLTWNFPPTNGGPDDGVHNSMIENFLGNYNYSLAREIIQNSIDAKRKGAKGPVKVVFKLDYFDQKDFPGIQELQEIFNDCLKYWDGHEDTTDFLNSALSCLSSKKIPFLKISDYNTKGLSGSDDDKSKEWYNLIKSRGSSSKTSGEGGSFGIGKGAPFAASELRTIFYSTTNEKGFSIFQGIAELVSHVSSKDNVRKRGVGGYGYEQNSVRDLNVLLHKFWRKETGTDIYIAGYKIEKNWKENLVKSILRNFWYAIYENDLTVEIEEIQINQQNIEEKLTQYFFGESFKDYDLVKPSGNPLQYYKAIKEGTHFKGVLTTLGEVEFWFNEIESHMNYVAMMRMSHMIIYTKRFNYPGNFVAVFLCNNENGNKELRRMEPPTHDEWIPERNRDKGKRIIDEIGNFIRECISSMKKVKESGIIEIPDLYKYLPDDDGADNGKNIGNQQFAGVETDEETASKIQKKEIFESPGIITPQKVAIFNKGSKGTSGDGFLVPTSNKKKKKKKEGGDGQGDKDSRKNEKIAVRTFIVDNQVDTVEYKFLIRSQYTTKSIIKIYAVGEDREDKVEITQVNDDKGTKYLFSGNKIQNVLLSEEHVKQFNVVVKSKIRCSLKVEINDLQ